VISFAPSQVEAPLGSAFTLTLQVDNAADLAAIEAQIKYDPAVVRMNAATAADLLQRGGTQLTPARNVQEASGDATVTLSRPPNATGVSGSGGLVTITFLALAKGQTVVSVPRVALRSAAGVSAEAAGQPVTVTVK
jgi:general secretion pathway protein D